MTVSCSRCGETWEKNPLRAVRCPTCRADVDSPCRRPSGHTCEIHVAREELALEWGFVKPCSGALADNLTNYE